MIVSTLSEFSSAQNILTYLVYNSTIWRSDVQTFTSFKTSKQYNRFTFPQPRTANLHIFKFCWSLYYQTDQSSSLQARHSPVFDSRL